MNRWLQTAPLATIAHGQVGVMLSIADQADRPPRPLQDGDILELGGKRVRYFATPHVPHGWDAGALFEETTKTLFAGDLFTRLGDDAVTTSGDILEPALTTEDRFLSTSLTPLTAPTIRRFAALDATTLALMHAPAFTGDTRTALNELAGAYASRLEAQLATL